MVFVFIGWPIIFVALIVIFGVFTGPEAFGLVRAAAIIMGLFAVMSGIGGILNCWSSHRTVLIKTWNSILIAGISYCTWQAATLFVDFITEYYDQGRLSFLDGVIGGGFQFFLVIAAANMALMGLSDELGEKAYHSVFGTILFFAFALYADERIIERLLSLMSVPVRTGLVCVLIGSLVCTVVLTIKNGFKFFDAGNICKMWISIGITVAFACYLEFFADQLKMLVLPVVLVIVVVAALAAKNR